MSSPIFDQYDTVIGYVENGVFRYKGIRNILGILQGISLFEDDVERLIQNDVHTIIFTVNTHNGELKTYSCSIDHYINNFQEYTKKGDTSVQRVVKLIHMRTSSPQEALPQSQTRLNI